MTELAALLAPGKLVCAVSRVKAPELGWAFTEEKLGWEDVDRWPLICENFGPQEKVLCASVVGFEFMICEPVLAWLSHAWLVLGLIPESEPGNIDPIIC